MTRAQDLPPAIQWHEGMLLAPQHFQQLAARQDRLLHYQTSRLQPFNFGVIRIKIDNPLLYEGVVRVQELEAILPDGLIISHGPGDGDLQVDVKAQAEAAKQGPLMIHLAVPTERSGGGKGDGDLGRFASVPGEPVADESSGERPIRIPRLKPRLRLLATDAPPARFTSLPLLSVRHKSGQFMQGEYIPPLLHVALDSALGELNAALARRVREKGLYLMEVIRSPAMTTKPAVIEENKRTISFLAAALPSFEAVLRCGVAHPFDLYQALCALAGPISAIGSQLMPPVFPPYEHADLRKSFTAVRDFIIQTLEEGISEAFTQIPMTYENGAFGLNFERDWGSRVVIVGAKGQPGQSDKDIADWMQSSLVGSSSKFRMLRDRRVLGAPRQSIDRYEGLVAVKGMLLYRVTPDPEFVVPNEPLLISNANEKAQSRPGEIFVYVSNKG